MDFYAEQDNARRSTKWLVMLFVLAVLVLIALTNVLVALLLYFLGVLGLPFAGDETLIALLRGFSWKTFTYVSLAVLSTVFLVVLVKWAQLAAGGKTVAERLGGTRILPQTDDPDQRRCLNVVEEMALAAGLPVPPVYVLAGERGINAFAAGISPADAVIGITRGSLERFNREQLQGVIAHEFSHILNGDMRLNIRLAALLKGITFIGDIGEVLVRGGRNRGRSYGSSNRVPGQVLAVGLALWIVGWLGGLFAGFIKAAISRQKEYLADASAVQFTRNPRGVADALKVIGGHIPGTVIVEARATEVSHIFFGQIAASMWQLFATHPPLPQRIRRIDPAWDGQFITAPVEQQYQGTAADQERQAAVARAARVAAAATIAGSVLGGAAAAAVHSAADAEFAEIKIPELADSPLFAIPAALQEQAHQPLGANALVLALLFSDENAVQNAQMELVQAMGVAGLTTTVRQVLPTVQELAVQFRLPLLEMSLPALKCMSARQYRAFKKTLLLLARADQRIELFEWCVYQLSRHYLDPEFVQVTPSRPRFRKAVHVRQEYRTVLSVLAAQGHSEAQAQQAAFSRGAALLGLHNLRLRPAQECTVAEFSRAANKLADCYPLLKPRLLKGMALCAAHDDELTPVELEILVCVAAVMDCPVPASVRLNPLEVDRGRHLR